jgi:hypothetical protein
VLAVYRLFIRCITLFCREKGYMVTTVTVTISNYEPPVLQDLDCLRGFLRLSKRLSLVIQEAFLGYLRGFHRLSKEAFIGYPRGFPRLSKRLSWVIQEAFLGYPRGFPGLSKRLSWVIHEHSYYVCNMKSYH